MSRSRALSVGLLTVGSVCVTFGVYLEFGLAWALVVGGLVLIAADLLVPGR